MRRVLGSDEPVGFLDARGQELLREARRYYADASLAHTTIFQDETTVLLATWCGDWLSDASVLLLRANELDVYNNGVAISVSNGDVVRVGDVPRNLGQMDTAKH